MVWEKNAAAGKAWNYTYDNGGNILSRTEYTYSTNGTVSGSGTTTSYTYGDAEWGDLLTAYNGEAISYDGIGNPLSYRGWTMNWQGGRQLAGITKGSDTLSFAYNESGLRTSKTVNGVTHSYVWQGSKLAADITDAYALYFHYDSAGDVIGFTRTANGTDTEYFYVKNLQGDILKIITADGTEAAAYTYDAWGKLLTSTGDMADVNPLRYRGYYYDTETSLYYLQSRYYDPEVGRFINPDAYASTGQGILGANMFTYCGNNPVILSDENGNRFIYANTRTYGKVSETTDSGTGFPFIYGQATCALANSLVSEALFSHVGCEIAATYNILRYYGINQSSSNVLDDFVSNGYLYLKDGSWGSNPIYIKGYVESFGLHAKTYSPLTNARDILSNASSGDAFIVVTINAGFKGIHTYMVLYDGSSYVAYNQYNEDVAPFRGTLDEALSFNRLIYVIQVTS